MNFSYIMDFDEMKIKIQPWSASVNNTTTMPQILTDEEFERLIDPILEKDDKNRDGCIDYGEFLEAQRAARRTN